MTHHDVILVSRLLHLQSIGMLPRLVQFVRKNEKGAKPSLGARVGNDVIELQKVFKPNNTNVRTMKEFLRQHAADFMTSTGIKEVQKKLDGAGKDGRVPLSSVQLKAPIYDPDKLLCIGLNYKEHATESKMALPKEPVVFCKFPNAIVGPEDDIVVPPEAANELDYEVELVLVIGKAGRRISKDRALDHVIGITVGHDVSARDWQLKRGGGQWNIGKAFDTFAPLGPEIVPLASDTELRSRLQNLSIKCLLNGNAVQDSNTKHMIFKCDDIVSYLSHVMTLQPGDLIFTGTPPGVGFGRTPQLFLKPGDVVRCEVEGVGHITNKIVLEKV